jgi:membrane-anchored protein YejM (alkaline phosphatase superfamily)
MPLFSRKTSSRERENFLLITIDCGRYDAYVEARKPVLDKIGKARQAYTHGTFTFPAHAAMFQGMLPHVFCDEPFYNRGIRQMWRMRDKPGKKPALIEFPLETGSIIGGFVETGYHAAGTAAMAWFRNPKPLRQPFPRFEFTGIDAKRQVDYILSEWKQRGDKPFFGFINFGEAHGPYIHEGMPGAESVKGKTGTADFRLRPHVGKLRSDEWKFDEELWRRQVECISYLDARIGDLLDGLGNAGITVAICSDHGECFGEDGLYGHGFYHPKIMEVPLLIFRMNEDGTFTEDPNEIARRVDAKVNA